MRAVLTYGCALRRDLHPEKLKFLAGTGVLVLGRIFGVANAARSTYVWRFAP